MMLADNRALEKGRWNRKRAAEYDIAKQGGVFLCRDKKSRVLNLLQAPAGEDLGKDLRTVTDTSRYVH